MSVRSSRFNLYYPQQDGVVVYNAASGRWAPFSKAEATRLTKDHPEALSQKALTRAKEIGAVVPEDHDELAWYRNLCQTMATDRSMAAYIWVLTFRCNLQCPYCFEGEKPPQGEMSGEFCERLLQAVQHRVLRDKTQRLAFLMFGGEPLLKREECLYVLQTMKEWCQQHSVQFKGLISTNGVLLNAKIVRELASYLDGVQLTLDGPREIHDQLRVGRAKKPTFDRIVEATRLLIAQNLSVHIRVQVHRSSVHHLPKLTAELRQLGLLPHPLVRVSAATVRENAWCRSCQSFSDYVQSGTAEERETIQLIEQYVPGGRPIVQILPCVMAQNQICIDPAGNLYRCITDVGQPRWRVGHLKENNTFFFNAKMRQYDQRDPTSWSTCAPCPYLPLCGGGCPRQALHAHGTYQGPACNASKTVLDARIRALLEYERQTRGRAPVAL